MSGIEIRPAREVGGAADADPVVATTLSRPDGQPGTGDAVAERDGDDAVGGPFRRVHAGVGRLAVEGRHLVPAHPADPRREGRAGARRSGRADVGQRRLPQREARERGRWLPLPRTSALLSPWVALATLPEIRTVARR